MKRWLACIVVLILPVIAAAGQEFTYNTENAFRLPRSDINSALLAEFNYGRGLFDYTWHPVEALNGIGRGFGPLVSASSCAACHVRDGRGQPPEEGTALLEGLILLIADQAGNPDPVYGHQLSDKAVEGVKPEAQVMTHWQLSHLALPDGTSVELRRPEFSLVDLGYGPLAPQSVLSPRLAPPLIGLGLLAEVPDQVLEAMADPNDANGDGISGRINWLDGEGGKVPGRFGWKANIQTIREQVQRAAATDLGFTSALFPDRYLPCTKAETECRAVADLQDGAGDPDFDANTVRIFTIYASSLSVPPRIGADSPSAMAGEGLFTTIGCAACHSPSLETTDGTIHPYTDLLLHDLGDGLADGPPMGDATPAEWRTPPLWGIGRTEQVSYGTWFLHDGRARSLLEAILWHGGEAEESRDAFAALPADARGQLIAFLESL
ncbi:MAG: c-type cytochrome [Hyphomicrobiaceae bacterium]|nr:c-type cytochrome [Hyphomicrobiaceae bacterium]